MVNASIPEIVQELRSQVSVLEEQRESVERELRLRREELEALLRIADRLDLGVESVSEVTEIAAMDRTSAVLLALGEADGMSPNDVVQYLRARGRDDSYEAVSAALAYLKRSGRAHTPKRAVWKVGPPAVTEERDDRKSEV